MSTHRAGGQILSGLWDKTSSARVRLSALLGDGRGDGEVLLGMWREDRHGNIIKAGVKRPDH
jgi:hypothetical protein